MGLEDEGGKPGKGQGELILHEAGVIDGMKAENPNDHDPFNDFIHSGPLSQMPSGGEFHNIMVRANPQQQSILHYPILLPLFATSASVLEI